MRNILYFIATVLALAALWFLYAWFKADPNNQEPLPTLLFALSSVIMILIAWFGIDSSNKASAQKSFWRFNNAKIQGNDNKVKQGTKGKASLEKNDLDLDGSKNDVEQG